MNNELLRSLVGSHTEFNFKNSFNPVLTAEKNILEAKKSISKDVEVALCTGGKLAVMLLGELTAFYRTEPYYMAVRSYIQMRRYRPLVLEYLHLSVEERADALKKSLSESIKKDTHRDLKISALKYFLSVYTGRLKEFRSLLTREEFLIVS